MKCEQCGKNVKGFFCDDGIHTDGTLYRCICGWKKFIETGSEEDLVEEPKTRTVKLKLRPDRPVPRNSIPEMKYIDDAFDATNKRIDQLITRLLDLENEVKDLLLVIKKEGL